MMNGEIFFMLHFKRVRSAARCRPTLGIEAMAWLIRSQVRTSVRMMRLPWRSVVVCMVVSSVLVAVGRRFSDCRPMMYKQLQ